MSKLEKFKTDSFIEAAQSFFKDLGLPILNITEEPTSAKETLKDTYKENESFQLIDDVYFVGMVDDAAFENKTPLNPSEIKNEIERDYDGILIFALTLNKRPNDLLPTRSQLAEISRAFNREFYYTPVVIVFKYNNYLAFANTERLKYKQEWREGEKAGKVSLLRDIYIEKPHSGHERILSELEIPSSGTKKINTFATLYAHWQEVFSVNLLNKKFYQELSNWYFWAIKNVVFPSEPTIEDAHRKNAKLEDLIHEHRATNVIRMLTRLLFVWFIKEKKLIPEELFELESLQKDILNEIEPFYENGLFTESNKDSVYYKAILQNLFFATLNCPILSDDLDKRFRGFRREKNYGDDFGNDWLYRYKKYFKSPEIFLELMNSTVPFLNGGLFECLDDKPQKIYIDGFSDNLAKGEQLIVPDYLFFGLEEEVDLSDVVGISDAKTKQSAVKGLINILKSYKFTITENTPIEEDVALDPELLGKVFENLLASYNPETKTTARKQTGSFYTPREIVNYMVDESLIAYLENAIKDWEGLNEKEIDEKLHQLTSFDTAEVFADKPDLQKKIVMALSTCTILDPACGSGAFPMGILQKMVHILQKLDSDNKIWYDVQLEKAEQESKDAFKIDNKEDRGERLQEINEVFDRSINDPDYARKLFLIENCIYGVDIQPIATQISKLRFFISLITDQKVSPEKTNFGIRPLPNLETKFVAANTLIGIEKESGLFFTEDIQELEKKLKVIRSKLFNARTKETKNKYRKKDEELRTEIAKILKKNGLSVDNAEKLATWDPYDQNASSPFFDPEWMFDIEDGFDVVIGNPPYVQLQKNTGALAKEFENANFETFTRTGDIYSLFYEKGINVLKQNGHLTYITSNKWMRAGYGKSTRQYFTKFNPIKLIDLGSGVFESATVDTNILIIQNAKNKNKCLAVDLSKTKENVDLNNLNYEILKNLSSESWTIANKIEQSIKAKIEKIGTPLKKWDIQINYGVKTGYNEAFIIDGETKDKLIAQDPKSAEIIKPILRGRDIKRYKAEFADKWLIATFPALNLDINDYSAVKAYLETFGKRIYQTGETFTDEEGNTQKSRKKTGNKWFETQDQVAYHQEFEKEKIVWASLGETFYTFCEEGKLLLDTNYFCVFKKKEIKRIVLAFLNSKPIIYYINLLDTKLGEKAYRHYKYNFEKIPIPKISESAQEPFVQLVDQILQAKEKNQDSTVFEKQIDNLVYKLYHLTDEEIAFIEKASK